MSIWSRITAAAPAKMLAPFITAAVLKAINVQICMPDKIIFRLYPFLYKKTGI